MSQLVPWADTVNCSQLSNNPGRDVDAYFEYTRIVGDDDGGTPFTPEQFEDYKRRVLPMRLQNRLYVSWTNSTGMDCKLVGPETPCFCKHRYKQHKTDYEKIPDSRPILVPCEIRGCRCESFCYIPLNGSQPLRCSGCKHFADEHSEKVPNPCAKGGCRCQKFHSSFSCGCQKSCDDHTMIVETKDEREARGHPVGQDVPFKAMGGLTGFSSLAEGYQRLDPSGAGAPGAAFLNEPITANDHPFLRSNVQSITAYHRGKAGVMPKALLAEQVMDPERAERESAQRRPGEDDMAYFERRYQERLRAERGGRSKAVVYGQGSLQTGQRLAVTGNSNMTQSPSTSGGRGRGRGQQQFPK